MGSIRTSASPDLDLDGIDAAFPASRLGQASSSGISFEPVEGGLKVLAESTGPDKILWATDYPHRDGFFPGAPQMIKERLAGASPEVQHQVLAGHAIGFYGLN